jgi:hypothetical protein
MIPDWFVRNNSQMKITYKFLSSELSVAEDDDYSFLLDQYMGSVDNSSDDPDWVDQKIVLNVFGADDKCSLQHALVFILDTEIESVVNYIKLLRTSPTN